MTNNTAEKAFKAAGEVTAFLDHFRGDHDDVVIEAFGRDVLTVGMLRALVTEYAPCNAAYGGRLIVHCGRPAGHDGAHKADLAGGSIGWHGDVPNGEPR
jgi:hypothetical protein